MQTIQLAKLCNGKIIALDNYQPFLDILIKKAKEEGFDKRIITKNQSMHEMNYKNNTFEIICSKGALYFIGFQNGLKKCYQILENKRYLAVTEAVFILPNNPKTLKKFWDEAWGEGYPGIRDIKSNKNIKKILRLLWL